jgi:hypothetical protein
MYFSIAPGVKSKACDVVGFSEFTTAQFLME